MTARSTRNNNPGNIRNTDIPWEGLMPRDKMTPKQLAETKFEVFRAPWWGIRAVAVLLRNYQVRQGLKTVRAIINRWAPPADDNPTSAYVAYMAAALRVDPDQDLDLTDFQTAKALVQAIAQFESGEESPFYDWEYNTGLILAGIEPRSDDGEAA